MRQARDVFLIVSALSLLTGLALAEVVYLNNGDIVHGELVGANNTQVTLKTVYGELKIPKKDIQRIDYQGGEAPAPPAPPKEDTPPARAAVPRDRAQISLAITGIVATQGISGNWLWWSWAIAHLTATFLFARM